MADLYLRKVEIEILPAEGKATKIDELRIKFKCEKTNESHPNPASIEIYNLSDRTRSLLEAKNTRVSLKVGYQDTAEMIFIGSVTKVAHKRETADIITTLEVADGGNKFRNARLEKGYPPGIGTKAVMDDLATALGFPVSAMVGVPDVKYANGLTLSGLARDHLNNLTSKNKLEWSIQDESLQVIPRDRPTLDSVILLSPDTGLIGFPAKTDKGVEFVSLIQPRLRPGRSVKIESRVMKGIFKIRKVTHEGDAHQGDFLSKCEATAK